MPSVALSQVKLGDRIGQDVVTSLGGILFHKGRVVTPREYEILQAFLISNVDIEPREETADRSADPKASENKESKPQNSLEAEYDKMFKLLKKIYSTNTSGFGLPILELRMQLEALLKHTKDYNILTFSPRIVSDDDYIFHNSVLCALTSYQLAQWNLFPHKDWIPVALAGLFHDIGNVRIDRSKLFKPTALTPAEAEEMKSHTIQGYNLLKNVAAINEGVKLTALQHHEKIDGTGYPSGLAGDTIHPYARIVAVADIFHAMTLQRVYRKAISPYLVLETLQKESFGKLDPLYVRAFIEKVTQFHNGTVVRLSDNRIGEIVFSDRNHPTRPWVSVNGTIINLTTTHQLHIESIIQR